jgi:hypothetical protein
MHIAPGALVPIRQILDGALVEWLGTDGTAIEAVVKVAAHRVTAPDGGYHEP